MCACVEVATASCTILPCSLPRRVAVISLLERIYQEWQWRVSTGISNGLGEKQARSLACDKDAQLLFELLPEVIAELRRLAKESH